VGLSASGSRRLRPSHRLPDLAGLVGVGGEGGAVAAGHGLAWARLSAKPFCAGSVGAGRAFTEPSLVRLTVSASRPLRPNHRFPDLASSVDSAGCVSLGLVGLGLPDVLAAGAGAESGLVGATGGAVAGVLGLFCAAVWAALGLAGVVDEDGWLTAEPGFMVAAPAGRLAGRGLVEAGASPPSGLPCLAGGVG
jgi:hypothetical protein